MEPYFPDGSIAFCTKAPIENRDIGVFSINGSSGSRCQSNPTAGGRYKSKEDYKMGLIGKLGGSLTQGVLGNMSEVSVEELAKEYGAYLMDNETIQLGFRLVRDVVLFTDKRIVDFDKQGATGQKMRVDSINLNSIVHVSAETSGFGLDDSEINISYIASPYYKATNGVSMGEKTFEFPKKYNIQPLYKKLQEIAYENHENLNK